jgi:hypothetical protein
VLRKSEHGPTEVQTLRQLANGPISKCLKSRKMLVDVTGIEPVTPCLQSKQGSTMWLILLAFTYVM